MANLPNPGEPSDEAANDADLATDEGGATGEISPVDFNMLVLSLNASALIHLGQGGDATEASGSPVEATVDLPLARNAIDMLCMLERKTRGNLTGEEERLLNQVLFDLRVRYAKAADR